MAVRTCHWGEDLSRGENGKRGTGTAGSINSRSVAWHWRRRAALARALAMRPEILFLEDPLRGLDWRHTAWWIDFLQRLWRGHDLMRGRPLTIVASTDEFRPWRQAGAQFAILREQRFEVAGDSMPEDDSLPAAGTMGAAR